MQGRKIVEKLRKDACADLCAASRAVCKLCQFDIFAHSDASVICIKMSIVPPQTMP